ncbi:MAG: cyclic nucleotide-binding domain-containing protein [Gammaproteobacteria bacterium]|nr:cyclic nucleotide-binding domain-containing protein [Gammaproteobacteria bacterium]
MTISTKLKKVLFKLSNLYFPFNNLSPERLQEIVNHIRLIELQQDEILQLRGGKSQDYLYLLEGSIDIVYEGTIESLNSPEDTQRSPVLLPAGDKSCSIIAKQNCIICHANRETLDTIIAWDHIGRESGESIRHMDMVRNVLVFNRLPIEYIETAFQCMRRQKLRKNDVIQGDQCDAYYLIVSGRAEVQRTNKQSLKNYRITELGLGDTFGNEALVSGKNLSETIVMLEDTELLILDKSDYQKLIERPLVRTVHPRIAQTMLDNGYQLLDVRFAEEFKENHIPGARLIPLSELSRRMNELEQDQPYIIYCHSGPRSAIATLILNKNKFEALSLEGGIRDWPYEIEEQISRTGIVPIAKKIH